MITQKNLNQGISYVDLRKIGQKNDFCLNEIL